MDVEVNEPDDLNEHAAILEALHTANHEAKRLTRLDSLSRESQAWAKKHEWLNHLLDLWQAAQ